MTAGLWAGQKDALAAATALQCRRHVAESLAVASDKVDGVTGKKPQVGLSAHNSMTFDWLLVSEP